MELLDLTKKLMSFKSISEEKIASGECIKYIIEYVKSWSFGDKIFIKEEDSNGFKSVMLSNYNAFDFDVLEVGHIDVVPVNDDKIFEGKVEGEILYGRGSGDMKAAVAVGIQNLKYILDNNLNIKYGLLVVSDEEIDSRNGVEHWLKKVDISAKVILDGDSGKKLNTINVKSKGILYVKLVSHGENAHGSLPWLATDAIDNLILTMNNVRKVFPAYSKNNVPEDKWVETLHIGSISGGKATNVICDHAEAMLDIRFTEKCETEKILSLLKESVVGNVDVILDDEVKTVFNDVNNQFLQKYKEILGQEIKEDVIFGFSTGATDARYFSKNGAVIIANQPDCGELHNDKEWLNITKLNIFAEVRKKFLLEVDKMING